MLSLSLKTSSVFNFCEAQFEKLGSLRGSAGRTPANNLVTKKEEYLFSLSHHIKFLLKKKNQIYASSGKICISEQFQEFC